MTHQYSNTAVQTTLAAGVNAAATSIQVSATTGFPVAPYVLALDADGASQELVLVTSVAGTTLTVTRGYDNTTAVDHSVGAVVRHSHAAKDFKDSRDHEAATVAHGATGAVVGTTNVQALTNKDLSSGTNTFPASLATDAEVTTAANNAQSAAIASAAASLATHEADTSTHGVGEIVGRTEVQTLTNKTLASPVITGVGNEQVPFKTADESVSSSVTLQDDNHLSFTVEAGAKYIIDGALFFTVGAGGAKYALNGPALTALKFGRINSTSGGHVTAYGATLGGGGGDRIGGYIECSAAGTVTLQWAQSSSDPAATTLLTGSWLRVRRVA